MCVRGARTHISCSSPALRAFAQHPQHPQVPLWHGTVFLFLVLRVTRSRTWLINNLLHRDANPRRVHRMASIGAYERSIPVLRWQDAANNVLVINSLPAQPPRVVLLSNFHPLDAALIFTRYPRARRNAMYTNDT